MKTSRIAGRQSQDGMVIDLPPLAPGWTWMKVGSVGEVKLGRQRSPEHHQGTHMRPYLRVANVYEDRLELDDVMQMNFTPAEFETFRLRRGDILLNEGQSLEWVGRPAMFRDEVPGACFQNTLIRFRPHAFIDGRFALSVFRFYLHCRRFQKIAKWTTNIAHLGAQRLAEIEFPVPPLEEQRRIVAKIEELFSDLDAGVAALERVKANLKRYRAAVLKAAVEGRLTEDWRRRHPDTEPASNLLERILADRRAKWEQDQLRKFKESGKTPPKGWKERYEPAPAANTPEMHDLLNGWSWASVEQLGDPGEQPVMTGPFGSTLGRGDFIDSGVPLLTIGCLTEGGIKLDKAFYISAKKATQLDRYRVREGDLLFSRSASVGRAGLVTTALTGSVINYHLMRLRLATTAVNPVYFIYFVRGASEVYRYLRRVNHGATRDGINTDDLLAMPVALPPLAEQAEIVGEVDRRLSVADAAETQVEHALQRAARLRQAILKRAFEGRLVPQEANDGWATDVVKRRRSETDSMLTETTRADANVRRRGTRVRPRI